MNEQALERAQARIAEARADGGASIRFEAALERSRAELQSLARATAELETGLPDRVGEAVREGLAREVLPVGRNLAEIRGLLNQSLRRLERIEQELLAEREARLEDFAVLVELVASGWRGVDGRLERLESDGGVVVQLRSEHAAAIA